MCLEAEDRGKHEHEAERDRGRPQDAALPRAIVDAARGVNEPNFLALLKLVGEGAVHVKVSAPYRVSARFPDYADARALHEALLRANPERLMWGTDWPHPSIAADVMPDDGHLLDLLMEWTPDETARRKILVETPQRLFEA